MKTALLSISAASLLAFTQAASAADIFQETYSGINQQIVLAQVEPVACGEPAKLNPQRAEFYETYLGDAQTYYQKGMAMIAWDMMDDAEDRFFQE